LEEADGWVENKEQAEGLIQTRYLMAYHNDTLYIVVCKYPTYKKEM